MAITYKWDISEMKADIQSEGKDKVITKVMYSYQGSEEVGGVTYYSSVSGAQGYIYQSGDPFTDYANTEAFEDIVIGWLVASLDVPAMKTRIDADIDSQKTPVETDLYFTWQTAQ